MTELFTNFCNALDMLYTIKLALFFVLPDKPTKTGAIQFNENDPNQFFLIKTNILSVLIYKLKKILSQIISKKTNFYYFQYLFLLILKTR
jgi:hypothetical protein